MQKDDQFYRDMQKYIAITTIGPSALRNQGSKGVIKAAQKHLADIDLQIFRAKDEPDFLTVLDQQTEILRRALPPGAQNWGAARKAINLFLRDICYNRFLCERHGLAIAEDWMEIPLDSLIAASLKRKDSEGRLPRWPVSLNLSGTIVPSSKHSQRALHPHRVSRVSIWTCASGQRKEKETANKPVHRIADKSGSR